MKKYCLFILSVSLLFLMVSCSKREVIVFDESNPLSLEPGVEWAVIVKPYAAFRQTSSIDSNVIEHGRKGDVMQVIGKEYQKKQDSNSGFEIWYKFSSGWLLESDIKVYDNQLKANNASNTLLK